ncbi:hypothetical protein [Dinghuibacter silviterrae]|uniref:Uncharacterized protein n=1 Tax=Dinghuibacter silviterrae TaxID=1539049 RepID=A0A4R8DR45_9BACT|nr:hypothetical protein [Dinghuibacter silviterrae]TDW99806.1 hypothetical protein EDB95_0818 [Dinghuibacter silviterrae]
MLRNGTVFLLLLAFMASTFSKVVIVADFYVNQDYIAKNLCENRDKPMMHCCGRCQLRKRLAHQENQESNNPERRSENSNEVLFAEEQVEWLETPFRNVADIPYTPFATRGPIDRAVGIFHPPA